MDRLVRGGAEGMIDKALRSDNRSPRHLPETVDCGGRAEITAQSAKIVGRGIDRAVRRGTEGVIAVLVAADECKADHLSVAADPVGLRGAAAAERPKIMHGVVR